MSKELTKWSTGQLPPCIGVWDGKKWRWFTQVSPDDAVIWGYLRDPECRHDAGNLLWRGLARKPKEAL